MFSYFFFFNDTATTEIYTLPLHDALPILIEPRRQPAGRRLPPAVVSYALTPHGTSCTSFHSRNSTDRCGRSSARSEEHTSELQSRQYLVCRLLLEKKIHIRDTNHHFVKCD